MMILFLEKVNFLSKLVLGSEITITDFLSLLAYVTPAFLVVSIPIALLLSSLIAFAQFSSSNEITAMRSCGVGLGRIMLPVFLLSLLVFAADYHLSVNVQHYGNYKFIKLLRKIITERISLSLSERTFFDKIKDTVIYVDEKDAATGAMNGIFIFDSKNGEKPEFITASQGRFVNVDDQIVLQLFEGSVYSGDRNSFRLTKYEMYELVFNTDPEKRDKYVIQPREMSETEIRARIKERTERNENHYSDEVEIYKRYSLPFSCIILAMLGAPLGVRSQRSGRWSGISLGIGAIMLNYLLMMLFEGLGREGIVHPALATTMPNILMAVLAVYLVYATTRETMPFTMLEWFEGIKIRVAKVIRRGGIARQEKSGGGND